MFAQSCLRTSHMPNFSHHQKDLSSYQDASNEGDKDEKRLDIVDLSKSSLRDIPDPCMSLASICKLDLSNNNIQCIPESVIARLLNLMVLDVHSNQLASLPNSIGCLSKLKLLNISSNMLRCLPRTIENCRSLEELNANFNKLTRLPETMGFELVNLKKLSINSNQIMFLPYSTSHMTALRVLDARLNCLRSLPNDLENLINLQVLNISQNFNYLNQLPYSIGFLLSLVELDVAYNRISTLPPSISRLRKLQRLRVEGNPIVSPPLEVVDMGLHAVKLYLAGQLNLEQQSSPKRKKKPSWLGHFKLNGKTRSGSDEEILEGSFVASPRSLGTLSPRRLFSSPRRSLTRLQ